MKINKYVEDLKAKSAAELNDELVAAKKELFNLRFQNATNQLDNTSRIKEVQKEHCQNPDCILTEGKCCVIFRDSFRNLERRIEIVGKKFKKNSYR